MDRLQALDELKIRLFNENLIKHSLAVEAIMIELAMCFSEDIEKWGLAGLMHDIDLDRVKGDMSIHSLVGAEILENLEFDDEIVYAVKSHNSYHRLERRRKIDKALFCADPISGLITASALISTSKKLNDISVEFVYNRFKEKRFAKGVSREQIKTCDEIGLTLERFIDISLNAMKKISNDLEL